ncbi:MAG: 30S ribosomal protein S9 [Candidatus Magasanikbacteria bacterium CG10_big_fil_rev_8_21_14_0_10_40_10]|uniref:Small ribosomal subunit protein uS9 n=1 Tax=Candidatus Magasanikbacteria bacterium CG10_big_fil_rev_8_21_14_0_10_40_10 TaxID=1974648 RepID=A0A2M6W4U6_9BACT|nr:MAG: 30S ribosomal protein S9 [Candidatus Magasanikbacteria bacterium CG10_big_fil_rev_8_21_14_0_10_40_10]
MVNASEKIEEKYRAIGRRKSTSSRVLITMGEGKITINGRPLKEYLGYFEYQDIILAPLRKVNKEEKLDVSVKVSGGGTKGQAVAIQHGIARALVKFDEDFKKILKAEGFLTRDPRIKERKKPGKRGARRGQQWKKR